jgi:RNA recognition motif-containing protein
MATAISSLVTPPALHRRRLNPASVSVSTPIRISFRAAAVPQAWRRGLALRVSASSAVLEAPEVVAARKLYVGNIPRTVTNDELRDMFAAHGTVERTEVTLHVPSVLSYPIPTLDDISHFAVFLGSCLSHSVLAQIQSNLCSSCSNITGVSEMVIRVWFGCLHWFCRIAASIFNRQGYVVMSVLLYAPK